MRSPRELIYSAGLFDYLEGRMFSRILGVLYGGLSAGGMLAIGNVAAHNPDVARALSELRSTLAPDLANRLDTAVNYFMNDHLSSPNDAPSASTSATGHVVAIAVSR